jgi:hypothetical protein
MMSKTHGSTWTLGLGLGGALAIVGLATTGCSSVEEETFDSSGAAVSADPGSADEVTLVRSWAPGRGHWISVREAPGGFIPEWTFTIRLSGTEGALFACKVGRHAMLSVDPNCEGQEQLGFVGHAPNNAEGTRTPLYRCRPHEGSDHFVSIDGGCEGQITEGVLGFVEKATMLPPPPPPPTLFDPFPTSGN